LTNWFHSGNGKRLALLWLLIVSLLIGHNAWLWLGKRISPGTDILALLPASQRDPVLNQAFSHMVDSAQQRVVALVGGASWPEAVRAADAYQAVIGQHPQLLQTTSAMSDQLQRDWLAAFDQSRLLLLTPEQQASLQSAPPQHWTDAALSGLYGAFSGPKLGAWQDDPFALFSGWVQHRAQETPVRPRDGKLYVEGNGRAYVVVLMTLQPPAFAITTQKAALPVLEAATAAAQRQVPAADIITAGVVLHAAAAGNQAAGEMATIGIGSLAGILLLMWLSFRSLKPIALIATSIAVGCLGALSACWLLFGQIHLLTLVFGASLIGIAQDYGIYFLCARLGSPPTLASQQLLRRLLPGLALMLLAAIIGYMGLALTPFPGLQQMAVFSGLGLLFAWLTVICWFPVLVRPGAFHTTAIADRYSLSLRHWPLFGKNRFSLALLVLFSLGAAAGLSRLHVSDDIRSLQTPPKKLVDDQLKLGKLLDAPTPVQFYLVRGDSAEIVLQREEALKARLQPLVARGVISGYQAVSNWVPSLQAQQANRQLAERTLLADNGPLASVARTIGEDPQWIAGIQQRMRDKTVPLLPETFLQAPAGEPWRHLWLGKSGRQYASIVALRGVNDYRQLSTLAAVAAPQDGVQWVDKVGDISSVLQHYRQYMSWVILGAYAAIWLLLSLRYGRAAWRIVAPPAVATIIVLSLLGIFNLPLQLFHVLACMLILGLGVDYGIFLQEPSQRHRRFAWLTVGLSALSALLSFGLLALSGSPPLHAFGLTMLIGMATIWVIAPCFSTIESTYDQA